MTKNNSPLVSIIIATYNRAYLLEKSVESVLGQSYKNWEIIIADDGSTDDTEKIIKELNKRIKKINYIKSKKNLGIAKISNMGIQKAKGKYIAILDDDDQWIDKDKLRKQVEFLEKNSDYIGCGGGIIVIDNKNGEIYRYLKPETDKEIRKYMLFSNPMANTTTMFRKVIAREVGYYDKILRYSADRDFWMKMGKRGMLYNFPIYFAKYLMSDKNTSIKKIKPHLKNSLLITKRYKNDYPRYKKAIWFNRFQYAYSFLPLFLRSIIHKSMIRLKRKFFR